MREHDGVTDFCVDGQAGPVHEYACYLSVHTDDGSPVVKGGDGRPWLTSVVDRTPSPQDGPLSVVVPSPSVRTGVLDPKTGKLDFVDHQITETREVFPTLGGALLISTGTSDVSSWFAVDPGKPGTLWDDVLKKYDTYDTLDGHLVASKGDRIALLA